WGWLRRVDWAPSAYLRYRSYRAVRPSSRNCLMAQVNGSAGSIEALVGVSNDNNGRGPIVQPVVKRVSPIRLPRKTPNDPLHEADHAIANPALPGRPPMTEHQTVKTIAVIHAHRHSLTSPRRTPVVAQPNPCSRTAT